MMNLQTRILAIPSLSDLVDEFTAVLDAPIESGVAQTEGQSAVLGNVRAAFVNQRQIPLPTDSSAGRGAFVALQHAASRIAVLQVSAPGDRMPAESDSRISDRTDADGRLNPMALFDPDDLAFGLFPLSALAPALADAAEPDALEAVPGDAIALVIVEDAPDWETWMTTFAR